MSSSSRVLVCGGREFTDGKLVLSVLRRLRPGLVIEGGARGADSLAGLAARRLGIPVRVFPADWSRFGRRAGYLRNAQMLREGQPSLVVAFPGGVGTACMVRLARQAGVPVWLVAANGKVTVQQDHHYTPVRANSQQHRVCDRVAKDKLCPTLCLQCGGCCLPQPRDSQAELVRKAHRAQKVLGALVRLREQAK